MKKFLLSIASVALLGSFALGVQAAIEDWDGETPANNDSASPDGFPEGMAPSGVNDSAREVMRQMRRFAQQSIFATYGFSSNGSDAYAITPTIPLASHTTGQNFWFSADVANTGTASLVYPDS